MLEVCACLCVVCKLIHNTHAGPPSTTSGRYLAAVRNVEMVGRADYPRPYSITRAQILANPNHATAYVCLCVCVACLCLHCLVIDMMLHSVFWDAEPGSVTIAGMWDQIALCTSLSTPVLCFVFLLLFNFLFCFCSCDDGSLVVVGRPVARDDNSQHGHG